MRNQFDSENEKDARINEVLKKEYFDVLKLGGKPSLEQITKAYPQLADQLLEAIEQNEKLGAFFEVNRSPNTPASAFLPLPKFAGEYELLEQIGEGGMGVVFKARSASVQEFVAVKLIKTGLGDSKIIERFDGELKALSRLNHANIPMIIDSGITEHGQPYFAMELLEGKVLTQYCNDNGLDVKQRLKLFITICDAIQHAHDQGIIHRDIKPSNILVVASTDGQPIPKIIDFGLAKAMYGEVRLTENSLTTEHDRILGTLKYMSPEQIGADEDSRLDLRSDVYSLGVVLYELLTGTTPVDQVSAKLRSPIETLKQIDSADPLLLSECVGKFPNTTVDICCRSENGIGPYSQRLRTGLDWIVAKALERSPEHRYYSAKEFANDVDRFLGDQPVKARPPSVWKQVSKLAARNQTLAVASIVVFISLLAATIVSTMYSIDANSARTAALKEKAQADKSAASFLTQLNIVKAMFSDLNPYMEDLDDSTLRDRLTKKLLATAEVVNQEVMSKRDRSSLLSTLGSTLSNAGMPEESLKVNQWAWDTASTLPKKELLSVRGRLAASHTGLRNYEQAVRLIEEAKEAIFDSDLLSINSRLGMIHNLAFCYAQLSQHEKAIHTYQLLIALLDRESSQLSIEIAQKWRAICMFGVSEQRLQQNNSDKAINDFQAACHDIESSFGENSGTAIQAFRQLAKIYNERGEFELARKHAESACERAMEKWGPGNLRTALCWNSLVSTCGQNSHNNNEFHRRLIEILPQAESSCLQAIQKLKKHHPTSIALLGNIASAYGLTGQRDKGIEIKRTAVSISENQFGRNSDPTQRQIWGLAIALKENAQLKEAIELLSEHLDYVEKKYGAADSKCEKIRNEIALLKPLNWLKSFGKKVEPGFEQRLNSVRDVFDSKQK